MQVQAFVKSHGPFVDDNERLKVRGMVVDRIQQVMIDTGFFPCAGTNDDCAMHVLGCTRSQAKQNMGKFTAVVKMTNDAVKNFKSEMGKRTKAELVSVWTGENKLYDSLGKFDAEVSEALLQGDYYRLASEEPPEEADYFACEDYRKIIYASWPLTQHQLNAKHISSWDAHNHIHHLTAHQLAFADVKVRSLVLGETSIPKTSTEQEGIIERYEQMINDLLEPHFESKYVKVVKDGPVTPP